MTSRTTTPRPTQGRLSATVLGVVIFVSGIAPLATDMYVPAFPTVAADYGSTATQVQLTLTTFFVGMALGQLLGGPVSDQRGRRGSLLASLVVLTAASVVCALAPSITVMMLARLVQGFSGGWAMVVARAVVVDLAEADELIRSLNVMAGVGGVAPIAGPLLGGIILQLGHWRLSFWALAALSAAMVAAVLLAVPESLPPERRHSAGLGKMFGAWGQVLRNRVFVANLVSFSFSMGVTFAYVATSAFILQNMNGLSPMTYSVVFAGNAVGLMAFTLLAARLVGRVPTRAVVLVGLLVTLGAGALLLAGALWLGTPLWVALVGFFLLMSAQGLVGANSGGLASAAVPEHPGTGSALLGFLQWCMAGVIAPIAGLGGDRTAVPMALIIVILALGALAAQLLLGKPAANAS